METLCLKNNQKIKFSNGILRRNLKVCLQSCRKTYISSRSRKYTPSRNKQLHTCHISHCEIKSQRIWSIWKAIPIKNSDHRIYRVSQYNRFYEEININHILSWFSQASYIKKKTLDCIGGTPKWCLRKSHRTDDFVKSPLKFCLISQVLIHSWWHVCN